MLAMDHFSLLIYISRNFYYTLDTVDVIVLTVWTVFFFLSSSRESDVLLKVSLFAHQLASLILETRF